MAICTFKVGLWTTSRHRRRSRRRRKRTSAAHYVNLMKSNCCAWVDPRNLYMRAHMLLPVRTFFIVTDKDNTIAICSICSTRFWEQGNSNVSKILKKMWNYWSSYQYGLWEQGYLSLLNQLKQILISIHTIDFL